MNFKQGIELFLKQIPKVEKPFLLGFSGGSDSLALAYSLIEKKVPLELAHFDHKWREQSTLECEKLKEFANSFSIPFYSASRTQKEKTELAARNERYQFFTELFESEKYEALLLAHHQNDQVETVLKRVLEGASLIKLQGMKAFSHFGEIPVWRPLLDVPKAEILKFLDQNNLKPIEDETNHDPKYLRTRLRQLIPYIGEKFGKEITSSFLTLSKRTSQLEKYLDRQTEKYQPIETPKGAMWDFAGAHPVEIEYVLKKTISLKRGELKRVVQAIHNKAFNHKVNRKVLVDRQKVFHACGSAEIKLDL